MVELTLADIAAAREAIGDRLHQTPVFSAARISEQAGTTVALKAELFQRTGSFKPRGAFAKLARLTPHQRELGVIAASSGNHAQALAYCAKQFGVPCTVAMWNGASEQKIAAARYYGANVDLTAADAVGAANRANELAAEYGLTVIPAYDDIDVIAGQGTLGLEIVEEVPEVDVVLVPVSGGGLLAGVATAVKALRPSARIVAVEPERSPSLALAFSAGRPVQVPHGSIADGLGAPAIGVHCLAIAALLVDQVVHVTDDEIVEAMRWLYQASKLAAEPAGAATTAALLSGQVRADKHTTTVAIVSGGNLELNLAARLLADRAETYDAATS
jgi:threonine dehydratase